MLDVGLVAPSNESHGLTKRDLHTIENGKLSWDDHPFCRILLRFSKLTSKQGTFGQGFIAGQP